jgi:hypothetical protein
MTHAAAVTAKPRSSTGRAWFSINALVAWLGLGMQFVVSATGMYPTTQTVLSQLGPGNPGGTAGALPRIIDFLSYFTIWSNIVVALVLTALAFDPRRDTPALRVFRLDALLMITITGIVYAVVLAPTAELTGWQVPANALLHIVTPLVTILVWLLAGPRGWIRWSTIAKALILPAIWVAYTLARGAVIGAYPYPFIDVVELGYGRVAINLVVVAAIGVAIAAVLLGVDRLLGRRTA